MEITYDIIIKYLQKDNNKVNFSNKKHILTYSDRFHENFNIYLQNKFYKYGISIYDNNINISLYTSIFTLLNEKFITFTIDEEIYYIKNFKTNISDLINTINFSDTFDFWLQKNNLTKLDIIYNNIYNIQFLTEIFDINILILDFKNNNINIAYPQEKCNPWKPIIILCKYEDLWEPLMTEIDKTFSYNNIYIKKILKESSIEYYQSTLINKTYLLNTNINSIINKIESNNNEIPFIKPEIPNIIDIIDITDIELLNKKTKNELSEICKNRNIKVTTKMLKKDIINLLTNK